jgi:non-canonical (house-cleaning) NTP pyrophosphatase
MNLVVCTKSNVKLEVVRDLLSPRTIETCDTNQAHLPEQPINSGLYCCHQRINYVHTQMDYKLDYDYILAIENGIDTIDHLSKEGNSDNYIDICYVVIEDKYGNRFQGESVDHYIKIYSTSKRYDSA